MRSFRLTLLSALLAAAALLPGGCKTVPLDASGDTQAVYQFGTYKMLVNSHCPATVQAAEAAFKQLDLYETKRDVDTYHATLEARDRDDALIWVRIRETNRAQTLIEIRVGAGGSLDRSQALYQAINRQLASAQPAGS